MRIAGIAVDDVDIPFREPLLSGSRRWQRRRLSLLTIHTDDGLDGSAESSTEEPHGPGLVTGTQLAARLEGVDLADTEAIETALRDIDGRPSVGASARAAVESAVVDLLARARGLSVAASLTAAPARDVAVNALLGVGPRDVVAEHARALVRAGYRCLKLKGGDETDAALVERVGAVREAVGASVALRLDLNGALDLHSAAGLLERLAPFDLEYVEQPIPLTAGATELARLRRRSGVPLAADESVLDMGSARELLAAEAVDALVVKPSRVGGIRQASRIVELATSFGVSVTLSTLFASGIGLAGALHVAATAPGSHAHGLATGHLLASDLLGLSLPIVDGRMAVPSGPGLGVALDPAAVARYRVPLRRSP